MQVVILITNMQFVVGNNLPELTITTEEPEEREELVVAAAQAKATINQPVLALAVAAALVARVAEQTQAAVGLAAAAVPAVVLETAARLAIPVRPETLVAMATIRMDRVVLAARQVLAAAQPVSTSVVYPMSHSRTTVRSKEGLPNAVHYP